MSDNQYLIQNMDMSFKPLAIFLLVSLTIVVIYRTFHRLRIEDEYRKEQAALLQEREDLQNECEQAAMEIYEHLEQ